VQRTGRRGGDTSLEARKCRRCDVAAEEDAVPATKNRSAPTRRFPKKTPAVDVGRAASELIDRRIGELQDWRGELLARLRAVIRGADPGIVEEWKWNVPVWSCGGIVCTGETYKQAVKLTFAKGASLPDPAGLFNSSLQGNVRRAIDFTAGATVDATALTALVRAAVTLNKASIGCKSKRAY
jgi:hypothetical protein